MIKKLVLASATAIALTTAAWAQMPQCPPNQQTGCNYNRDGSAYCYCLPPSGNAIEQDADDD